MKRTRPALHWLVLLLSAGLGCDPSTGAPPPPGGQSGDDGSEFEVQDPVGPPEPCEPEETLLDEQQPSLFGGDADALLAGLDIGGSLPLFWVPFDGVPESSYAPGPGRSEITVRVERRPGEQVVQSTERPTYDDALCPGPEVRMPVALALASADGALEERVNATLTFTSAKTAQLTAQIAANALGGTFAFQHIGPSGEVWEMRWLGVGITFWPGGSSGGITPALVRVDAVVPPRNAWVEGPMTPPDAVATPAAPEHWSSVAGWPRIEGCNDGRGGGAFDANDPLIGLSPVDLASALGAVSPWSLSTKEGDVRIGVQIEPPQGLICVAATGPALELDVRATLRAESAPPGSPLEHLSVTTILRIGGRAALDGSGIDEFHWSMHDLGSHLGRADFEAQTGVTLTAPDEYQDIWWSWHGRNTRPTPADPWSTEGALLISSLNAEQSAQLARQVAQGGPGPSIGVDDQGYPVLPGDVLLDADIEP